MRVVQSRTEVHMTWVRTSPLTPTSRAKLSLLIALPTHFSTLLWKHFHATIRICPQVPMNSCFFLEITPLFLLTVTFITVGFQSRAKKKAAMAFCKTYLSSPSSICPVCHHAVQPITHWFPTSLEQIPIFLSVLPFHNPHIICYCISSRISQIY